MTVKFPYKDDSEPISSFHIRESVSKQSITIESPETELTVYQYYELFKGFLRAIGFSEYSIMNGACNLAFNETNDEALMNKLMDEYELQDKQIYSTKDYEDLRDKYESSVWEVQDLKAKLSRLQNPDNPNYTDEEMDAMCSHASERKITKQTLVSAYKVCHDCGTKYGSYSVGCSSRWIDPCDVCGEIKGVTEARDYNYLREGIEDLSK